MYQTGCELGKHWAIRDATTEQLLRVLELGNSWDWVACHDEPAEDFTYIVDPGKSGFMGLDEKPSAAFVAGFIDGAQAIVSTASYTQLVKIHATLCGEHC